MEGKILGIPVIIIVLALVIAALVDVPMILLNVGTQADFIRLNAGEEQTNTTVSEFMNRPTLAPTATPSASPTTLRVPVTSNVVATTVKPTPIVTVVQKR